MSGTSGTTIDNLNVKINASSTTAITNLNKLSSALNRTATSMGVAENMAKGMTSFTSSLRSLSNLKTDKITSVATALKDLGRAMNTKGLQNLKDPINIQIDTSQVKAASEQIQSFKTTMQEVASVNVKDTGITTLVNAVKRLSEADNSGFSGEAFKNMASGIQSIASLGDVSDKVTRLISSLAKLANAGTNTSAVAESLPKLGTAIQQVATSLSSANSVSAEMNSLVSGIASLANAGNKTGITASQLDALAEALRRFMVAMQGMPEVSANMATFVSGLGMLASAGSKAGTAAESLSETLSSGGLSSRLHGLGQAAKSAMSIFESAFTTGASAIKSAVSKISGYIENLKSAMNPLAKLGSTLKTALGVFIGYRGIMGAFSLLKQSVTWGGDLTEIDHIVESVFTQDMVSYVHEWADDAITQFGIASAQAKQYAGTLSAMFQASGVNASNAGNMAMDLVGLAGDLSAFYNIDTATAFEKIRSGMSGMVRPLRSLGIDLTAATLEEYRLAQGITTSYSAMSQAEKVMLRYQYLMDVTTTQQGDFQRTNESLANSLRTLKAYAQACATQIGVGLAAAIRPVIVLANALMSALLGAAKAFAIFMQTIFGKYVGGVSGLALESSDYVDDLADSADDASSGLGGAAGAAKDLKDNLSVLPFDELNQLNKDNDSSGGGGGGGGSIDTSDIEGLLSWQDAIESSELGQTLSKWGQMIKDAFNAKDWVELGKSIAWGINKGIKKVYKVLDPDEVKKKVDPFIEAFTTTLNSLVDSIEWETLGGALGEGITDLVYVIDETIAKINWKNIGRKLADFLYGAIRNTDFSRIGKLVGDKIMIIWNALSGFTEEFKKKGGWAELGRKIGEGINGFFDTWDFSVISGTFAELLNGAFETLKNLSLTIKWSEIAQNITDGINKFIKTFDWEENAESLNTFLTNLCNAIKDVVGNVDWYSLGTKIANFLEDLPWGTILSTLGSVIIDALGGVLSGLISTPSGAIATAVIAGFGALKFASSSFGTFASALVEALTGNTPTKLLKLGLKNWLSKTTTEAASEATVGSAGAGAAGGSGTSSIFGSTLDAGIAGTLLPLAVLGGAYSHDKYMKQQIAEQQSVKDAVEDTSISYKGMQNVIAEMGRESSLSSKLTKSSIDSALASLDKAKGDTTAYAGILNTLSAGLGIGAEKTAELVLSTKNGVNTYAALGGVIDKVQSAMGITNASTSKLTSSVSGLASGVSKNLGSASSSASDYASTTSSANKSVTKSYSGLASGVGSALSKATSTIKKSTSTNTSTMSKGGTDAGNAYVKNSSTSLNGVGSVMTTLTSTIASKQSSITANSKTQATSAGSGYTSNFKSAISGAVGGATSAVTGIGNQLSPLSNATKTYGTNAGSSFKNAFKDSIVGYSADPLKKSLKNAMDGIDLSAQGKSAANTFVNAFKAVKIPVPHIHTTKYTSMQVGSKTVLVPSWSVSWYRSGGLFTGGKGQVIGIAEDNRDEAVLPLEDRKAMARIGSAIADAGGSGLNNDALDRVANRIIEAIMMTQNSDNTPMINLVVKTESDEVLARAVTRGQRKIDYRTNATTKLAY